jgi:hypothetical protein
MIHTEFHVLRATRDSARSLQFSTTGLLPPLVQFSAASSNFHDPRCCPTTPNSVESGLGWSPFARRYSGNRFCFLFLRLLRCFNSPRSLAPSYGFRWPYIGLPHSDTLGSMPVSGSPRLFAGNHVLLRLCVPRYPP